MIQDEDEPERLQRFAAEVDAIRARIERELGATDVDHIVAVNRFSRTMEWIGRGLIYFSFEPIGFSLGVLASWLYRQLQASEIGHTVLHGVYDHLEGAERFRVAGFSWDIPVDEEAWRYNHNILHHHFTNIVGRDPDIGSKGVRLNGRIAHEPVNRVQLPLLLFFVIPNFGFLVNAHYAGLDALLEPGGKPAYLADRSADFMARLRRGARRKLARHYAKEYLFFPALAGPFFWKVILGNWLSSLMTNVYTAVVNYCGHVGAEVHDWPAGTRARTRGEWYKMQVESTNDFEVPLPISILCGALDRQIEHHLFPSFPTPRLRAVAPEVRALCAAHGVEYRTASWPRTIAGVLRRIARLSSPRTVPAGGAEAPR